MVRYSPTQLNYFKFISIVVDEFPKALRHVFKTMWDNKYPAQPWDDSVTVHNKLRSVEVHSPMIPIGTTYEQWDCTALFQATIYAKTFEDPVTRQTLNNKYLKSSIPPEGSFRPTVTSSTGDQDERFALAIDQLRLLRNEIVHSPSTEILEKAKFQEYIAYTMAAFTALGYDTSNIDDISKLPEDELPSIDVPELKKRLKKERPVGDVKERLSVKNISRNKAVIFIIAIAFVLAIAFAIILEVPIVMDLIVAIYTRLPNGKTEGKIDSGKTWNL